MPPQIRNLHEIIEDKENQLIFEKNVDIPTNASEYPVRCNVYRPLRESNTEKVPVIVTYGPYGKDIYYGE